jgi:hypothetical protein
MDLLVPARSVLDIGITSVGPFGYPSSGARYQN